MTMETLPTEVLAHILQYLPPIDRIRSERVCRKWRDVSRYTWKDVKELYIIEPRRYYHYGGSKKCTKSHEIVEKEGNRLFICFGYPKMFCCFISRVGCCIEKLYLDTFLHPENERIDYPMIISFVCCYCRNLKSLIVGIEARNYVKEEWWPVLFDRNQELHSVMYGCGKNLIEVLPFRNWRSLRFTWAKEYNEEKIISLIEHSEALEEFESNLITTRVIEALQKLRNLRSLYYTTPIKGPSPRRIFDASMLSRLKNLNFTDLTYQSQLLCDMLPHCCQLESLCINSHSHDEFPIDVLEAILAVPTLVTLKIDTDTVTDDTLIHLTKFKSFSLRDDYKLVTNKGILEMIMKSEFLEHLDIESTAVTSKLFKKLVRKMNNRQKYLNVVVPRKILNEVSKICAGSKIRLVKYIDSFDCAY